MARCAPSSAKPNVACAGDVARSTAGRPGRRGRRGSPLPWPAHRPQRSAPCADPGGRRLHSTSVTLKRKFALPSGVAGSGGELFAVAAMAGAALDLRVPAIEAELELRMRGTVEGARLPSRHAVTVRTLSAAGRAASWPPWSSAWQSRQRANAGRMTTFEAAPFRYGAGAGVLAVTAARTSRRCASLRAVLRGPMLVHGEGRGGEAGHRVALRAVDRLARQGRGAVVGVLVAGAAGLERRLLEGGRGEILVAGGAFHARVLAARAGTWSCRGRTGCWSICLNPTVVWHFGAGRAELALVHIRVAVGAGLVRHRLVDRDQVPLAVALGRQARRRGGTCRTSPSSCLPVSA